MPLRTVGNSELAWRQLRRLIERVEQPLADVLAGARGSLLEERQRQPSPDRRMSPGDGFQALTAFVGGTGHSCHYGAVPRSSVIVVGNEILRGFTVDTNSNWLAGRLFDCGFPVRVMTTVGDVDEDIVRAVRDHLDQPDLARIFVCGGLGPTPDDRTYLALAHALDRPLVYHPEVGLQMQNRMFLFDMAARRGTAELNAGNRKMARLPEGATLVRNGAGMAPGLAFELANGRYLFALPGVPAELRSVYEAIQERYLLGEHGDVVRELRYQAVPESAFHDIMQALEAEFPDVSLGSYPQTETRELILRASGRTAERVEAVLTAIRQAMTQYRPVG